MMNLSLDMCYLFTTMLGVAVIILAIDVIILYMVMKPRIPSMQLTTVTVSALSVTENDQLTATFDVSVMVRNPNTNLSISYERIEVAVLFGPGTIASATVGAFRQQAEAETLVRTRFTVTGEELPGGVVRGIEEQRGGGSVDFGVTLVARMKFWWRGLFCTRARSFTFECFPLHIVFPSTNHDGGTGSLVTPSHCYLV